MRLSEEHTQVICQVISRHLGKSYKIFLYGSRVDDALKGGDIDLLLLTNEYDLACNMKFRILAEIKARIGDQRIDLTIKHQDNRDDPFVKAILAHAVELCCANQD